MVLNRSSMKYPSRTQSTLLHSVILLAAIGLELGPTPALASPAACRDFLLPVWSFLIGRPTPKRSEVLVSSPMVDFLNSHSPEDREVIRLFTRHPKLPVFSPNYIPNMMDSIRESFAPWFEKKTPESFQKMLKMQHAILTLGIDSKHPYLSTSMDHALRSTSIGRFRYQKTSPFSRPHLEFAISDLYLSQAIPPGLQNFLDEIDSYREYLLPIASIPEAHRPEARITVLYMPGGGRNYLFKMRYPENHSTEYYLGEMAQIMEEIRDLPPNAPKPRTLHLLADYIQLFSAGLPFDRVNFSIAMAQVNYVLMSHGLRGIENGELDLISAMVDTTLFRKIFSDFVLESQSDPH